MKPKILLHKMLKSDYFKCLETFDTRSIFDKFYLIKLHLRGALNEKFHMIFLQITN